LAFKDEVDISSLEEKVEEVLEKETRGLGGVYILSIDMFAHRSDTIRSNGKRALGYLR